MAEWTIATVCKTVARQGYLGSNPSLSTYFSGLSKKYVLILRMRPFGSGV